jgi:hypothetical protein
VQGLYRLVKSDEQFNALNHQESVIAKMDDLNAWMYLETLNYHSDQEVYEANQELIELTNHFRDMRDVEFE